MKKRRSLICLFIDKDKKEYCIRNRNTDFFGSSFQKYLDAIPSEGDYSLIQETMIINRFFANNSFEVLSIIDAENKNGTDQKTLSKFKDEYSKKFNLDGYSWNSELDTFYKDSYNENEENNKLRDTLLNLRNLQTLYEERGEELSKEIIHLTNTVDNLRSQKNELKKDVNELSKQKDVLEADVNTLRSQFKSGKLYIKEQREEISSLETKYNECLNELDIEYKHKIDEFNEHYQDYVNEKTNDANNELKEKKEELSYIESRINNLSNELNLRLNNFNDELNEKRDKFNQSCNKIEEEKKIIENEIVILQKEKQEIESIIKNRIDGILNEETLLTRLDNLINMVKMNKQYYNGCVPKFEVEFLSKMGLNKDIIITRIKENNLGIKE